MTTSEERKPAGAGAKAGLALLVVYVIVLALATASELLDLGWFDHPLFK